jgi:hypothetical protein
VSRASRDASGSQPAIRQPLTVEIRTTHPDGSPTNTVLGSASAEIPADSSGNSVFTAFDLLSEGIEVSRGDVLAVVVPSPGRQVNWNSSRPENSIYAGGEAPGSISGFGDWSPFDLDFHFQVFVSGDVIVVDQENDDLDVSGVASLGALAQTFTVGANGFLHSVDGQLGFPTGDPGNLTVEIRSTNPDGSPTDAFLGSGTAPIPVGPNGNTRYSRFDVFDARGIDAERLRMAQHLDALVNRVRTRSGGAKQ